MTEIPEVKCSPCPLGSPVREAHLCLVTLHIWDLHLAIWALWGTLNPLFLFVLLQFCLSPPHSVVSIPVSFLSATVKSAVIIAWGLDRRRSRRPLQGMCVMPWPRPLSSLAQLGWGVSAARLRVLHHLGQGRNGLLSFASCARAAGVLQELGE